jgi:hypothetical protein
VDARLDDGKEQLQNFYTRLPRLREESAAAAGASAGQDFQQQES